MSYHGRLEQALPRENWRRWPWPLPICVLAENLPMEQVVSSCGMYLRPILVPVNRWKRWESCWLASCQGCTAEGRFACIQCGEFCVFFVLPKGHMVQWGMGFSEVWGVTICCCYITVGFLSAGISSEGSALEFFAYLNRKLEDVFRKTGSDVRLICSLVQRHAKTWSHIPRHTMAGSSESWFWVWLFFPMGVVLAEAPEDSSKNERCRFAPRKTCCIGSPSAKTVCASTSAWGMAIVSWGPDIICNWIQYLDSIEVHDVSLVIAETDYCYDR